jgi:hypothetical protein
VSADVAHTRRWDIDAPPALFLESETNVDILEEHEIAFVETFHAVKGFS